MRKKLLSIFMALAMVLSLAPSAVMADDAAAVKYKDGTYTQSVKVKADDDKDFDDYDITVQVDIAGGKITSVTLPEDKNAFGINEDAAEDNEKYIGYVLEGRKGGAGIPAQIVEKNSADVDVVSKATCISNAMIDAVSQILAANVAKEEAPAAEKPAAEKPAAETPASEKPAQEQQTALTGITLSLPANTAADKIAAGSEVKLTAAFTPANAANKNLVWSSSDEKVATVDNGTVKALTYGHVTITAASAADSKIKASIDLTIRFYDVNGSNDKSAKDYQYYYDHVYWAAENGITKGYNGVYFGPERTCERRELMIFLWRVAGCPDAAADAKMTFNDMSAYPVTSDTYKAVLWAVSTGVSKGYDDGGFHPTAAITRKDTLILMYRTAGKPAVTGTLSFSDVTYGADTDTYKAILWASQNGITNGYADKTFRPVDNCLREHIITFLGRYDALKEPEVKTQSAYVLMNIPYAEFYKAEGVEGVDIVSSSTVKTFNQSMAAGSYHDGYEAPENIKDSKILGITYPVFVEDEEVLKNFKEVTASDKATITVAAGKSETTTKEVEGADILFASGDYAYYRLDAEPSSYKTLNIKDGKISFAEASAQAQSVKGLEASVTYDGHHTEITLKVANENITDKVHAIVLTAGGEKFALRHVEDIWKMTELGWNWDGLDGNGLAGKTITNITYYVSKTDEAGNTVYSTLSFDTDVTIKLNPNASQITAKIADSRNVTVSGLPSDIKGAKAAMKTTVGKGETATVIEENAVVSNGAFTVTDEALKGQPYTITITSDNYADIILSAMYGEPVYAIANIPYAAFYAAEGASVADVDAVASATNKTGNYGKAGGAFHSAVTAKVETAEDGTETVTAVGGENGSQPQGAIWAVKVNDISVLERLGGSEITDESKVTIATVGRGQSSSTNLVGYEALVEAPAYSYYVLDNAPDFFMELDVNGKVTKSNGDAVKKEGADAEVTTGGHWGDIQLDLTGIDDTDDKLVNGIVLTAVDSEGKETKAGLYALDQIWSNSAIAWTVSNTPGLDGKTITNVRFYCMAKDADNENAERTEAPAYENYVFDYSVNIPVTQVYTGEITASFNDDGNVVITGLPEDAENTTATIYYSAGGRGAVPVYLTPLIVDPADDDIDPSPAIVEDNGVVVISQELIEVTNQKGETKTYGQPVEGTTYIVAIGCDNYVIGSTTAAFGASTEEQPAEGGNSGSGSENASEGSSHGHGDGSWSGHHE